VDFDKFLYHRNLFLYHNFFFLFKRLLEFDQA